MCSQLPFSVVRAYDGWSCNWSHGEWSHAATCRKDGLTHAVSSKETLLTPFLFHAACVSSQVKDQGEKAAFMLPLPPLALGPILKALHLGEGLASTRSCYIRVVGQKPGWEDKSQWIRGVKKPFREMGKGRNGTSLKVPVGRIE